MASAGVDSLTLVSEGHHTATVQLEGRAHVDVWLEPLGFSLSQATVSAVRMEPEGQTLDTPELMQALDNTPGLQSLDLGAGMIQPVVRGLFGSRVAVEDGVPQQGGRWGSDHGVLVAPELKSRLRGCQVEDKFGWALRLWGCVFNLQASSTRRDSTPLGAPGSVGAKPKRRSTSASPQRTTSIGMPASHVGIWGRPSASTDVLDRTYTLETGGLPNTAGRAGRGVGLGRWTGRASRVLVHEVSDVRQGMFPGIVGLPAKDRRQRRNFEFDAEPACLTAPIPCSMVCAPGHRIRGWVYKVSTSWNRRREFARLTPTDGDRCRRRLELVSEELAGFAEARHTGAHGSYGAPEVQHVTTTGWEFLLPSHRRARASWGRPGLRVRLSGRVAAIRTKWGTQSPGSTPRATWWATMFGRRLCQNAPGGMLSWQIPLQFGRPERTVWRPWWPTVACRATTSGVPTASSRLVPL